jgi:exopolysaccharide biosynthesis polyprenyl glycosylphosphotransferase
MSVLLERRPAVQTAEFEGVEETQLTGRRKRALIVGAGSVGSDLATHLESQGDYQVIGFVDDHYASADNGKWRVLGDRDSADRVIEEFGIEEVFVAYAPTWQQRLTERLAAHRPDIRLRVVPSPFEAMMQVRNVESCGDIALVDLKPRVSAYREALKRVSDIIMAVAGLVILAPVIFVVSILIKFTSRGRVIFAQERVGRNRASFILYKFRTMQCDAESVTGPVLSSGENDERLTPIGKWLKMFRIDEIPQLWNVLKGDMSFVGPRPERPFFVSRFERTIPAYSRRHNVRPGITGLAQVCGGYHTDARDKLRFDLIYVAHQSFWLDVSILLRTVVVVLFPGDR